MLSRKGQRVKGNLQLYYNNNNNYYLSLLLLFGAHRNFTAKKLGRVFLPQLLVPNNQPEKATARKCKVNALRDKILPLLCLKNNCMDNRYSAN